MTSLAQSSRPLFHPGVLLATPAATSACAHDYLSKCLKRHLSGDWGCVSAEDRESNDAALRDGERILSAYPIGPTKPSGGSGANCVWIITEHDRSVTTMLLPSDY
jgi:hypothetical protein